MPKENFRMGKGWRGEGPLAVAEADQALVERKGPTLLLGLACLRALPETPRRSHHFGNLFWHLLYEVANFNPVLKALAQAVYGKLPDASNEKAVEYFTKAIALQPQRVIHRLELGRTYLAIGQRQKARDAFNKGISLPSIEKDDDNHKARAREVLRQLQ
jgi:tetratricopeptide (TPR) repeat protein